MSERRSRPGQESLPRDGWPATAAVRGDGLARPARAEADPEALKACCAAAYQQDVVALVLGESYHPGGADLTRCLGRALDLRPGQRVLDVACGPGTTAFLLAEEFGVVVDGVDLGDQSVARATQAARQRGLSEQVRFHVGDAEGIPFDEGVFDVVVCECAFCTFPDKRTAAAEFARVLRPGGRLGVTDVTLQPERLDPELRTLAGWVACLADARPAAEYAGYLAGAGLRVTLSEPHDVALARMIEQIDGRLRALKMMSLPGVEIDFGSALGYTAHAARAVRQGMAGYHLLVAEKPSSERQQGA